MQRRQQQSDGSAMLALLLSGGQSAPAVAYSSSPPPPVHSPSQLHRAESAAQRAAATAYASTLEPPVELQCPITLELLEDPVVLLGDMHTYERSAIEAWLVACAGAPATSPLNGEALISVELVPADERRRECEVWKAYAAQQMLTRAPPPPPPTTTTTSPDVSASSTAAAAKSKASAGEDWAKWRAPRVSAAASTRTARTPQRCSMRTQNRFGGLSSSSGSRSSSSAVEEEEDSSGGEGAAASSSAAARCHAAAAGPRRRSLSRADQSSGRFASGSGFSPAARDQQRPPPAALVCPPHARRTVRELLSRAFCSLPAEAMEPWEADSARAECAVCERRFHRVLRWKHHCRCCGRLVCDACSRRRTAPLGGQRICDECAAG